MIHHVKGDLLKAEVEALINPVNIMGIMGKGLALQFRLAYPENYLAYRRACRAGEVQVGRMFVTRISDSNPQWIINFPTKKFWWDSSKLEWITNGLVELERVMGQLSITSVGMPHLGCGLGRLQTSEVLAEIEKVFSNVAGKEIYVYGGDSRQ